MTSNSKQTRNWVIDAGLYAGFVVSMALDLTGVIAHEFLGAAVVVLAGYHLLAHGQWVACTTRRLFGNLGAQCRRVYFVDALLAAGFAAIGVTGLAISTWLNLPLADYLAWRDAHVYASLASLALVVVKVGLHWRWVATVASRDVLGRLWPAPQALAPQPARTTTRVGRREFVRVMGVVGATVLVVGGRTLAEVGAGSVEATVGTMDEPDEPPSAAEPPAAASPTTTPPPVLAYAPSPTAAQQAGTTPPAPSPTRTPIVVAAAPVVTPTPATAAACVVQCTRGCSYPGACRRYVDANKNGKCDLGECSA